MLLSASSVSSSTISSRGIAVFASSLAFTHPVSTIVITDAEIESGSIALAPAIPVVSITGVFFSAALSLTQQANSINVRSFNGLAPWAATAVDNTRKRQQALMLQEIRQIAPVLKQIRQLLPMLGD